MSVLRRTFSLMGLAVLVALCVPTSAYACNEPRISFSPHEAGPGETVGYAISDTDAGAEYVVKVGGTRVAEGTDADGGGLKGSFAMPDLGDEPTSTYVEILVAHEGTWADSGAIAYSGRPASVQSDPAQPGASEPTETPAPVSSSTPAAPQAPSHGGSDPAARAPGSSGAQGPRPTVRRPDAVDAAPAGDRSGVSEAARRPLGQALAPVPVASGRRTAMVPVRTPARASRHRAVSERAGTRRPDARARVAPRTEASVRPALAAGRADGSDSLPLVALLAAGAVAGLALLVQRRRGQGPPAQAAPSPTVPDGGSPGDLELEAGLQEIVAEGRARELLEQGSAEPAERLPG